MYALFGATKTRDQEKQVRVIEGKDREFYKPVLVAALAKILLK